MTSIIDSVKKQMDAAIAAAYRRAAAAGALPQAPLSPQALSELTKDPRNGDFTSNFCLVNAKPLRTNPRALAAVILENLDLTGTYLAKAEAAGPGFLNFTVADNYFADGMELVLAKGARYGDLDVGKGKRVLVEFVSANPTGPMHLGNARGGVLGDSLAAVLAKAGYTVSREFYVNDAGNQVALFGKSLRARYLQHFHGEAAVPFPEDGYHGDDIGETAAAFIALHGDRYAADFTDAAQEEIVQFGLKRNIEKMQADLARYKITFDNWFYESTLHKSGAVARVIEGLTAVGYTYELEGATWLRLCDFYEDSADLPPEERQKLDEVLIRSNGFYTYFAADLAYHMDKFITRGFDIAIDLLGADHHGHTLRFPKALMALEVEPARLEFVLFQLVRLLRGGEMVRMSKRTGKAITLQTLLDEISPDAARFFFNARGSQTHLEFDLDLAVKEDSENPVYYVQYAHARICTLLKKLQEEGAAPQSFEKDTAALLTAGEERALLQAVFAFPEEIRQSAAEREPYRLIQYSIDLAARFHSFYNACPIKGSAPQLLAARFFLAKITGAVLKILLDMLKITAPEKM